MQKKYKSCSDANNLRDESAILKELERLKRELATCCRKKIQVQSLDHLSQIDDNKIHPASLYNSSNSEDTIEEEYKRLFVVSTKLPWKNHKILRHGGVSGAILPLELNHMSWVGWNGIEVNDEQQQAIQQNLSGKNPRLIPVFMPDEIANRFLNGFSNGILWPLFHYELPSLEIIQHAQPDYDAYKEANQLFANTLLKSANKQGDIIWIHDYQLMLLPRMLTSVLKKQKSSNIKVGFFFHIPFPPFDIFRILPWRRELLQGMLGAHLIGFQTQEFVHHFQDACRRELGYRRAENNEGIITKHGLVMTAAIPIGICPHSFHKALESPEVKKHIELFKKKFGKTKEKDRTVQNERKIILGIDRLDYTKGIPQKLYAMEKFLEEDLKGDRRWVGKVVLVQIAVPTRQSVDKYKQLKRKVHRMVARINGRFSTLTSVPIHYLDQSIDFYQMCALYHVSDALLCTSIRDGMNLVSYEFIACQKGKTKDPGMLILSEFASAIRYLGSGAVRINPWDIRKTTDTIKYVLECKEGERKEHFKYAKKCVERNTTQRWASIFIEKLCQYEENPENDRGMPKPLDINYVVEAFKKSNHRLIVCGVVGALTGKKININVRNFQKFPECNSELQTLINSLSNDPKTTFVALSSRRRNEVESVITKCDAWVCSENGAYLRREHAPDGEYLWENLFPHMTLTWMPQVSEMLKDFKARSRESKLTELDTYFYLHYLNPKHARNKEDEEQAKELVSILETANMPIDVQHDEVGKIIQIRPAGINKKSTIKMLLNDLQRDNKTVDFLLCLGSCEDDEETYVQYIPETFYNYQSEEDIQRNLNEQRGMRKICSDTSLYTRPSSTEEEHNPRFGSWAARCNTYLSNPTHQESQDPECEKNFSNSTTRSSQCKRHSQCRRRSCDFFGMGKKQAITCVIGKKDTKATYYLENIEGVRELFKRFENNL